MRVAEASLEIVAVHAVFDPDLADDGLDSRTTLSHAGWNPGRGGLAPRSRTEPARSGGGRGSPCRRGRSEPMSFSISAIGAERVPIEGIAMQCLSMEHELPGIGEVGEAIQDLTTKTRKRRGLCFADALDLRG